MDEIEFIVESDPEGGYVARAFGGCIFTQADTLEELRANVREAACCHCEEGARPRVVRLKFVQTVREEVLEP